MKKLLTKILVLAGALVLTLALAAPAFAADALIAAAAGEEHGQHKDSHQQREFLFHRSSSFQDWILRGLKPTLASMCLSYHKMPLFTRGHFSVVNNFCKLT